MNIRMPRCLQRGDSLSEGKNMNISIKLFAALLIVCVAARVSVAQPALKTVYQNHFLIGAALNEAVFSGKDAGSAAIVKRQFNTTTPENVMKWEVVHPHPDTYDFSASDKYVEFGVTNNMVIIGHTLIWHAQTPGWVFLDSTGKPAGREVLLARMRDHIFSLVGRYKDRVKGWDVVNEAIDDDGSMRNSPWKKIIGEEFILKAFQFAHEADPNAELYYNDYSAENVPKRNGVVQLVKKLQAAGIPVAGIGMQGHYSLTWPSLGQVDSTIADFGALGVKVMLTELDVDVLPLVDWSPSAEISKRFAYRESMDPYKNGLPDSVQKVLAARYADLFTVFVKHAGTVSRVTFWGVGDGTSWLNGWPIRGRTNYPLLFGRDGKTKPAFDAVVNVGAR
jgi:endo-1,4-beta-xylanase